jgi:hypothetical protein
MHTSTVKGTLDLILFFHVANKSGEIKTYYYNPYKILSRLPVHHVIGFGLGETLEDN